MNLKAPFLGVLTLAAACSAHAAIVVTIMQVGDDIVLSGEGSLNIAALEVKRSVIDGSLIISGEAAVINGVYAAPASGYTSEDMTGPDSFGHNVGAHAFTSDVFGDFFGAQTRLDGYEIVLPAGYVSGSQLSGYSTFADTTLAELGLVAGTYVWAWGAGDDADSFILNIIAVPEPAHYAIGAGLAALALVALRRRAK